MDMVVEGLISYDATGNAGQPGRQVDRHQGLPDLHHQAQPGLDVHQREAVNAKSFVDAWNFGASSPTHS
jgi:hypothetical protein